jgi:hypothetical protein
MSITLVSTVTVGSGGAASIDFTSIPASATDLVIFVSMKITKASGNPDALEIRFNGDTASNYDTRWMEGAGSGTPVSATTGATSRIYVERGAMPSWYTANTFGNAVIYIPNYAGSTAKSVSADAVTENNATASYQTIAAGRWSGTAAINAIKIYSGSSSITEYSTASLYLITKGSGGASVS